MKKKQDYGQLMIFMAIAVGLPRWAGAMMGADGIELTGWLADTFKIAYGISGLGMAVLEVLAIGYIFAGMRSQPMFQDRKPNLKFWGSAIFGFLILALIPAILTPFMFAQIGEQSLLVSLNELGITWIWLLAVVLAPLFIIGGVAFAREGIMEFEIEELKESKKERALRLRRENAQRKRDNTKSQENVPPLFGTDRIDHNWED